MTVFLGESQIVSERSSSYWLINMHVLAGSVVLPALPTTAYAANSPKHRTLTFSTGRAELQSRDGGKGRGLELLP